MTSIDLARRVAIFDGHADLPAEPFLVCTIEQFWEKNPETTFGELRGLFNDGWLRIGGGAAAAFTLKLLRNSLPALSNPVSDALETARGYIESAIEDNESGVRDGIYENSEPLEQAKRDLVKIDAALAMNQAAPRMLAALKLARQFLDMPEIESAIALAEGRGN